MRDTSPPRLRLVRQLLTESLSGQVDEQTCPEAHVLQEDLHVAPRSRAPDFLLDLLDTAHLEESGPARLLRVEALRELVERRRPAA